MYENVIRIHKNSLSRFHPNTRNSTFFYSKYICILLKSFQEFGSRLELLRGSNKVQIKAFEELKIENNQKMIY